MAHDNFPFLLDPARTGIQSSWNIVMSGCIADVAYRTVFEGAHEGLTGHGKHIVDHVAVGLC